jgi:hypothetical protein
MSSIFLNVSIEGIHQMAPQAGINPKLKIENWKSKNFTLNALKKMIGNFFSIPDSCDYTLALYSSNSDGWKNKEVLPPSTTHSRLKGRASHYVTKSNEMSILSVHVFPTAYIAVQLAFNMNSGFPKVGLVDFEKTNLMQQNPIAFIDQDWEKEELTAEMEKLIYRYMLRVAEMGDLPLSKCNLNIFSEDGNEHLSAETINPGDRVIVQILDTSGVIESAANALNWIDYPLIVPLSSKSSSQRKTINKRKMNDEVEIIDLLDDAKNEKKKVKPNKVEEVFELISDDENEWSENSSWMNKLGISFPFPEIYETFFSSTSTSSSSPQQSTTPSSSSSNYHCISSFHELSGNEESPINNEETDEILDVFAVPLPSEKYCSVCLIDHPVNEMYPINCCCNHVFCIESLLQNVKIAITGSADAAPHIPPCPMANLKEKGCKYGLQQKECEQIILLSLHNSTICWAESEEFLKQTEKLYLVSSVLCFRSLITLPILTKKY